VGLGKTVEACLITSRLARTGRAARILIVTPSALTVQWLGELYRMFHQVFVLLDEKRREDVKRELGPTFNPFEAHSRSIVALEDLVAEPSLTRRAVAAGHDLLIG
jgi:ATP-dependent helicase HepA